LSRREYGKGKTRARMGAVRQRKAASRGGWHACRGAHSYVAREAAVATRAEAVREGRRGQRCRGGVRGRLNRAVGRRGARGRLCSHVQHRCGHGGSEAAAEAIEQTKRKGSGSLVPCRRLG